MPTKVRIENGSVVELLTADPFPDFHPSLEWVEATPEVGVGWTYDGKSFVPPAPLPDDEILAAYTQVLQQAMDEEARTRGYDDIRSAIGYLGSTIARFASEAAALNGWRDAVWLYGFAALNSVQGGRSALPSIKDFVKAMPPMRWPEVGQG